MQLTTKSGQLHSIKTPCLVLGVYQDGQLSPSGQALDKSLGATVRTIIKQGDLKRSAGKSIIHYNPPGCHAKRLLIVALGAKKPLTKLAYCHLMNQVGKTLTECNLTEAVSLLHETDVAEADLNWKIKQQALLIAASQYEYVQPGRKALTQPLRKLITYIKQQTQEKTVKSLLVKMQAIATGVVTARTLATLPSNHCTPSFLASEAKQLAKQYPKLTAKVLNETEMKRLKMNSLLAVAKGSIEPPKFIILEYKGSSRQKPVVLVGKGVTFDSGGLSLKPPSSMVGMKFDMAGGASVFGTLHAMAEMGQPIHLIGIVPAVENMPSDRANKPDDVVTSMSGQTIEISNTDAEGRLILCDALSYAARYKPAAVIDIATLTGAMVVALGNHASGVFSNDQALAEALCRAGMTIHDRAWQMPLWDDYHEALKSHVADVNHIGGREAGSITAACFLSKFAEQFPWAHLDVAGTAAKMERGAIATGRPVPLLCQYLLSEHV